MAPSAGRYDRLLNPREEVLAEAFVQSTQTIGHEGAPRYGAVVTNQRLLLASGQRKPRLLGEWALADIQEVKGKRYRAVRFPAIDLTVSLASGESLFLGQIGLGCSRVQHLTEVLESAWSEEIAPRIKTEQEARARRLLGKEDLVQDIQHILVQCQPIDPDIVDEGEDYQIEAEEIALRLTEASSEPELLKTIHQAFVSSFDESIAGPETGYEAIASEIWVLQQSRG